MQTTPEPVHIALWGPSAAGKTTLLVQIFRRRSELRGWEIHPTGSAAEFDDKAFEDAKRHNRFPSATSVGHVDRVEYTITDLESGRSARVSVEDRAGRDYEKLKPEARDRLLDAAGLLVLIDVAQEPAEVHRHLRRALLAMDSDRGNPGVKDDRPVAVCLTKIDSMIQSFEDLRRVTKDPSGFALNALDDSLVKELRSYCSQVEFFAISAVGVRSHYGVVEQVVFYDEGLEQRCDPGGSSINLMAPFRWLLERATAG